MPTLSTGKAVERLVDGIEKARPTVLSEIYADFFDGRTSVAPPPGADIARRVRDGLEPDRLVDLWNVVFPADHDVWFNEETDEIHYNEEYVDYADVD